VHSDFTPPVRDESFLVKWYNPIVGVRIGPYHGDGEKFGSPFRKTVGAARQRGSWQWQRSETKFIADAAADLVGEAHVDRNRSLITAAEDFAYMLEACPGAFINIGIAGAVGSCPVHNPHYDFNDAALPLGASLFARLVEKKLPRLAIT
jgi:peptidase M20/M25/M40-like protein